jgi:hypothetical protein
LAAGLSNIRDRQWAIFKSSGLKGWGLEEGLDWLVTIINQNSNTNIDIKPDPPKNTADTTKTDAINNNNMENSPSHNSDEPTNEVKNIESTSVQPENTQ